MHTQYSVQCTVYSVHTLYSRQCILHIAHDVSAQLAVHNAIICILNVQIDKIRLPLNKLAICIHHTCVDKCM